MNFKTNLCKIDFVAMSQETTEVIDDFVVKKKEVLGTGAFGSVYKASNKKNGEVVAAKVVWMEVHDEEHKERVEREVQLHDQISHENIVAFIHSKRKDNHLWIFTEYCNMGDAIKYWKVNKPDTDATVAILIQASKGIQYLHSCDPPIVHRDIKPCNLLFTDISGRTVAKLCDLGASIQVIMRNNISIGMETRAGTEDFLAPEQFEIRDKGSGTYKKTVDIFSAGVLFWVLIEPNEDGELSPKRTQSKEYYLLIINIKFQQS